MFLQTAPRVFFIAFAAVLTLLVSCEKKGPNQTDEQFTENLANQYDDDLSPVLDNASGAQLTTSVSLPGTREPLQVYTRQLTDRAAEEQIVISRHPEQGNLEVFLISPRIVSSVEGSVADYRIVAQQGLDLRAQTFTVQTQDLTGDGTTQEIFISGQDELSGLQQAYVFQLLTSGAENNVVGLRRIFYREDSGSYEISYDEGGYYIVHQSLLDQSSYQLELTDLRWSETSRAFLVQNVEIIDNSTQLPDALKAVYRGSADDFFQAIDGLWILIGNPGSSSRASDAPEEQLFLYFDSENEEVLIYGDVIGLQQDDQIIEVYSISNMIKSLWNRLNLNVRNKYVYNIQNYFYVTLEDSNTIRLFALDGVSYVGTYQRVDDRQYAAYQEADLKSLAPADFRLEGSFAERSEGKQYIFQPDKMILGEADGTTWQGAYSLFSWSGNNYLEFHLKELNSFAELRQTYRIKAGEAEDFPNPGDSASTATDSVDTSVLLLYPVRLLQVEEVNDPARSIIRLEREQEIDEREWESLLPGS